MKHREAIESHLFDTAMDLFNAAPTVTLYDLTNTFFEGEAAKQPKARPGHSKEKRGDCPLLTLGLVLDGSGFVRRSKVFAGNVEEPETLTGMLEALNAPPGARVVMDRGIATEDRVKWLREHGYRYIVVSRERKRRFDAEAAVPHVTRGGATVHLHKVEGPTAGRCGFTVTTRSRSISTRPANAPSPCTSPDSPSTVPWPPIPACTACAATRPTGARRGCGAPTPC